MKIGKKKKYLTPYATTAMNERNDVTVHGLTERSKQTEQPKRKRDN